MTDSTSCGSRPGGNGGSVPGPHPAVPRRGAILVDVDGTLCDVRSVRKYVQAPEGSVGFKRDFDRFHSESLFCPCHRDVVDLVQQASEAAMAVVVVTGRESRWRNLTIEWMQRTGVPWDALHTRKAGDYRPDHAIKQELLQDIARDFEPLLAVDDRQDIIEVWQAAGIPTLRVSQDGRLGKVEASKDAAVSPRILRLVAGVNDQQ